MAKLGTERSSVQNTLVQYCCEIGWKYVKPEEALRHRGGRTGLVFKETFSDQMIKLNEDFIDNLMIEELIKPMQANPKIAICYGRQLPRSNARLLESFARVFSYPAQSILKTKDDIEKFGLKIFFCSNACSAIRCSIFKKLGGFKNDVIVNEDMLFAAKAILHDYSVYYSATAKVYHSHSYSLPQTFKRYFNIGRFFANNKWILKHADLKSYSGRMLKASIKTFWEKRTLHYIAALLIEFTVKALACKFGWYYQLLFHKKRDTHL